MRKFLLLLFMSLILVSCDDQFDGGNTITSVNKCMAPFGPDGKAVIFSAKGEGQIENMYLCGDYANWHNPGNCMVNVYCDGQLCVSSKLYELACLNMDYVDPKEYESTFLETPLFSKFGAHNSISLDFKIPYYDSCKVELVQPKAGVKDQVWTTVRANSKVNLVFNGNKLPKGTYFKGIRMPNQLVKEGEQYTMMESEKNTMIFGVNLFVNAEKQTTMESCIRAYDTKTGKIQLLSSGLEDFFIGTYYFDSGKFLGYKCGLTWLDRTDNKVKLSAYRQFPDNPICFNHPVKITVRDGEQNEIDSNSEINNKIYGGSDDATFGAICYYYEW